MRVQSLSRLLLLLALVAAVVLLGACDDEDDDVAVERDEVFDASPTALAGLNEDMDQITVEIADGEFGVDAIELQQNRPTVLYVENTDEEDYVLEISDLVDATEINAGEREQISFTTPVVEDYEAELQTTDGVVVDTMIVEVQEAGETGSP